LLYCVIILLNILGVFILNNKIMCCLLLSSLSVFSSDTGSTLSSLKTISLVLVNSANSSPVSDFTPDATGEAVDNLSEARPQSLDGTVYCPMRPLAWSMSKDKQYLFNAEDFARCRFRNAEHAVRAELEDEEKNAWEFLELMYWLQNSEAVFRGKLEHEKNNAWELLQPMYWLQNAETVVRGKLEHEEKDVYTSIQAICLEDRVKLEKLKKLALDKNPTSPSPVFSEHNVRFVSQRLFSSWPSYVAKGRWLLSPAQQRSSSHSPIFSGSPDFSGRESVTPVVPSAGGQLTKALLSNCSFGSELDKNGEE